MHQVAGPFMNRSTTTDDPASTPMTPLLRRILTASTVLVAISACQLFIGTEHTEQIFAWTIKSFQSAAFLGAGYIAAVLLVGNASRQRTWQDARPGVLAVAIFTSLTGIVTLLHLEKFHLSVSDPIARTAAWAWLAVYVVVPVLYVVGMRSQPNIWARSQSTDQALPAGLRQALVLQSYAMLATGAMLLLLPSLAMNIWPWELTPLTSRAIGAWIAAFGVFAWEASRETVAQRLARPFVAYAVLGLMQLVAVARYWSELQWSGPAAWLYLAGVMVVLATGLWGALQTQGAPTPEAK